MERKFRIKTSNGYVKIIKRQNKSIQFVTTVAKEAADIFTDGDDTELWGNVKQCLESINRGKGNNIYTEFKQEYITLN